MPSWFMLSVYSQQLLYETADIQFARRMASDYVCLALEGSLGLPAGAFKIQFRDAIQNTKDVIAGVATFLGLPADAHKMLALKDIIKTRHERKRKLRIRWSEFGFDNQDLERDVLDKCPELAS